MNEMNEKKMRMMKKMMKKKKMKKMMKMMIFYLSIDSTISNSFLTIPKKKKKKSACWRSWAMRRKGRARARDAGESLLPVFLKKRRADGSKGRGGWNQR